VAEAHEPLRSMILVAIHTGLRLRSEILTLEKQDVSLARGVVTVRAAYAKNGTTRSVPLNRAVRPVLARLVEQARQAAGRHPAHPAPHVRQPPRDGRRGPAHGAGARRLVVARDGGALRACGAAA
jgi:integrase